jgi:hypothetical protein
VKNLRHYQCCTFSGKRTRNVRQPRLPPSTSREVQTQVKRDPIVSIKTFGNATTADKIFDALRNKVGQFC